MFILDYEWFFFSRNKTVIKLLEVRLTFVAWKEKKSALVYLLTLSSTTEKKELQSSAFSVQAR